MGKKSTETRSIVLELLLEAEKPQQKSHLLIRNVLMKYDYLDVRDKAFIKRLAEGCIEDRKRLDYLIDQYAVTKNGKIKPVIRVILRMGIYQILSMDSVPDAAACNESVNLAVEKGLAGLKGFVNGILRKIARQKEALPWPDAQKEPVKYLSVYYSMPEWIVCLWQKEYGEEICKKMLQALREPAGTVLHIREDLPPEKQQEVICKMKESGYEISRHPYLPYAWKIGAAEGMERLYGYEEGYFTVQDVSSMLAVELADIKPGSYVIDVCAAPGGKSMHAAVRTGENGCVDARDLTEYKTSFIQENARRMKLGNLKCKEWDARIKDPEAVLKADYVIADLPCSGMGVMGRKSDIRYHITEESIATLQKLQREILTTVKDYVRPGGILVYSTCSVNREENDANREWLLAGGEFEPVNVAPHLGSAFAEDKQVQRTAAEGYLQLFPGVHLCDGFFLSYFRKK